MMDYDQPGVFLDGPTVRPIVDIGEVRYLEIIHSVSFSVYFFSVENYLHFW